LGSDFLYLGPRKAPFRADAFAIPFITIATKKPSPGSSFTEDKFS